MTSKESKERRDRADRRSGSERRTKQVAVAVERRKAEPRRSGIDRRLAGESAADQINAVLGLLGFAVEKGVFLDVDRWVLETAITRLHMALGKLKDEADK